jgi:hypothetical protein
MGWIPVTVMTAALPAQPRLVSIDGMMPERARRGRRRGARARRFRYARGGGGDLGRQAAAQLQTTSIPASALRLARLLGRAAVLHATAAPRPKIWHTPTPPYRLRPRQRFAPAISAFVNVFVLSVTVKKATHFRGVVLVERVDETKVRTTPPDQILCLLESTAFQRQLGNPPTISTTRETHERCRCSRTHPHQRFDLAD